MVPGYGHWKSIFARQGLIVNDGEISDVAPTMDRVALERFAANKDRANPGPPATAETFPTFVTVTGGFTKIPIGAALTVAAGESAWYPLVSIVSGENIDTRCCLFGVTIEQTSPDVNGVGGGIGGTTTPTPWGNVKGEGAAIVIGENLPTRVGGIWTSGRCRTPGVEASGAGSVQESAMGRELFAFGFPPGAYDDPVPYKRAYSPPFTPYVIRLKSSGKLDAGLVIQSTKISGIANKNIFGYATVQLHLGLPFNLDTLDY